MRTSLFGLVRMLLDDTMTCFGLAASCPGEILLWVDISVQLDCKKG